MQATTGDVEEVRESSRTIAALFERAQASPTSRRFAIHARCGQCESGDDDGGWRNRIRACGAGACPLHPLRPYHDDTVAKLAPAADAPAEVAGFDPVAQARGNPKSRSLAIRAYCWECQGGGKQPNVQQAIGECQVMSCALHHVRPYRPKTKES